jgi:hypothetical protein
MSLQVKSLTGPSEIRISAVLPDPPVGDDNIPVFDRTDPTAVRLANATATGIFTCELSRVPTADDYDVIPENAEENTPACFTITLRFYNNRGISINNHQTLQVSQTDVDIINRCVYFTIDPGTELTGTSFYVHALIINNTEGADNVDFRMSSYHKTILHVHVFAEQTIRFVYWSDRDEIKNMEIQESSQETANINSLRYIHIKTTGMYSETVRLRIQTDNQVLMETLVPLHRNHRSVTIPMKDMIARYCSLNEIDRSSNLNVTLNLKVSVSYYTEQVDNRIRKMLLQYSGIMELSANTLDQSESNAVNGVVPFVVDTGNMDGVENVDYCDFTIGFMCHIEGVGHLAALHDNAVVEDINNARMTVYPFHVYEILLSDLVKCGLVTLKEAIHIAPLNNQQPEQRRPVLENNFNKITQLLAVGRNTLISRFQDSTNNNRTKTSAIRKILTQVQHKTPEVIGDGEQFSRICRDAWQKKSPSSGTIQKIHSRPDAHRYSKNKESPFGDFFLNYLPGENHFIYASRYSDNRNIDEYVADANNGRPESPNPILRGEIAIHAGSARFSTGCLTFNRTYGLENYVNLRNYLYPESRRRNTGMLNFICIDERNAVALPNNDPDTYSGQRLSNVLNTATNRTMTMENGHVEEFHRYYDQVQPNSDLRLDI